MIDQKKDAFKTEQEKFWAGAFGDEYCDRNRDNELVGGNLARFAQTFRAAGGFESVLECGANVGLNLIALHQLFPSAKLAAIEINEKAVAALRELGFVDVTHASLLDHVPSRTYDIVFTSGVLIHIAPEGLPKVYDLMYKASARWVAIAEYYDPKPVEIPYRGHAQRMYKRDFAGEILDRFPDLRLVDYGFTYHRDPSYKHDDLTWFLMEKRPR